MILFLFIILLVLNIEASTNIVSKSEIFKPIRRYLFNRSTSRIYKFLHNLIDCPYCTSVWISLFYICALLLCIKSYIVSVIFIIFMLVIGFHRLSNILHHIIDRTNKNYGYALPMDKENE
jgi:hypothetical protein